MAMAHHHLNERRQAAECLAKAERWIEQADRTTLPDFDMSVPCWKNWAWHEHLDSTRLLDETRLLVHGTAAIAAPKSSP
jgi:hypothetical protein